MERTGEWGVSRRERLELTVTAILPVALRLVGAVAGAGGRLSWLAPAVALPVGLAVCLAWRELGEEDLPRGLGRAFGRWGGKTVQALYLAWGVVLLIESADRYARRLQFLLPGERSRWVLLLTALALCLWLGREGGRSFARTGRIFFLATVAAWFFALMAALPCVDWKNLWPPERAEFAGLPQSGGLVLSMAGYGVYSLCLPRRRGDAMRGWPWVVWSCLGLGWLMLSVVGSFGPRLTAELEDPFLLLMQGVKQSGAFHRGEAAVLAVLSLADLVLLTLLSRGCGRLWESVSGREKTWTGILPAGAAFLLALRLYDWEAAWSSVRKSIPMGNLIFGALIPLAAVLILKVQKKEKGQSIFSGEKTGEKEDVGGKRDGKKSLQENEKKC